MECAEVLWGVIQRLSGVSRFPPACCERELVCVAGVRRAVGGGVGGLSTPLRLSGKRGKQVARRAVGLARPFP